MKKLVGIDLGGTNIRAAVATGATTHGERVERDTPHGVDAETLLTACAECAREAAGGTPDGIAIGIPGPLDARRGIVYAAPNLSDWVDVPAQKMLEEIAGCPVAIENDANLAGYAEWVAGAGQGTSQFVFVTVSTGIGGCLILNGELYAGAAGTAGEIGHYTISPDGPKCSAGHPGCLEGFASGTGIAHRAQAAVAAGEATSLRETPPEQIDARAVADAAERGDELAIRIYGEAGTALGKVLGGLVNLLSPEMIVIGGGLIESPALFMPELMQAISDIAFTTAARKCSIVAAKLGTDAGLAGATSWAHHKFS